jgi:FdhE protein
MDSLDLVEGNKTHNKPVMCPSCGAYASAAYVGPTPSDNGNGRMLYCASCGTQWEYERLRCAHCGLQSPEKLNYFHVEGDDVHRLQMCSECGYYLRTVFLENLKVPFSFEVEDVILARLDKVAHDSRFQSS